AIAKTSYYAEGWLPHSLYNLNCIGDESTLFNCSYEISGASCGSYDDAGVICQDINTIYSNCTDYDIRLVNGKMDNEGIIQICMNGVWDCTNGNIRLQPYRSSYNSDFIGRVEVCIDGIWGAMCNQNVEYSNCTNGQIRLYNKTVTLQGRVEICYNNVWFGLCSENSHYSYYAAVTICEVIGYTHEPCTDNEVRLSGSSMDWVGRIELCVERTWTTLCDKTWDLKDAAVICRQLGYSSYGAMPMYNCFTEGQLLFGITSIDCTGSENHILNCTHNGPALYNCESHNDAGVICQETVVVSNCTDGELRLVDGSGPHEGRVEVCVNQVWGGKARINSQYGPGAGPILMASVDCSGSEESILECSHRSCDIFSCSHYSDAGVTCERNCTNGDIRLGDESELKGRVEVCMNEIWSTICTSNWSQKEASVICFQLGYSKYANTTQYGNCADGDIRLIGGDTMNDGNVQLCYNNAWGSICDANWDNNDSNVACYKLGLQPFGSQFYVNNYYGVTENPSFVIGGLSCSGSEESLLDCPKQPNSFLLNCNNNDIAGVHCLGSCMHGTIRLKESTNYLIGEVEVCIRGVWSTVCGEEWDDRDAKVVCRQIGLSPYGSLAVNGSIALSDFPMRLYGVRCEGTEDSILECVTQHTQYGVSYEQCGQNKAGVVCQVPQTPFSSCTTGEIRLIGGMRPPKEELNYVLIMLGVLFVMMVGLYKIQMLPGLNRWMDLVMVKVLLPIMLTRLQCTLEENSLLACGRDLYQLSDCDNTRLAGVKCEELCTSGDIRIVSDTSSLSSFGRVDFCVDETWGTICDSSWTEIEASVVCRQKGFSRYGAIAVSHGLRNILIPTSLDVLNCNGTEEAIYDCNATYGGINSLCQNDAGIICQEIDNVTYSNCTTGSVRLIGPADAGSTAGRVEVCINKAWGSVCDDEWSTTDANVVCDQLGYYPSEAIARYGSYYGKGSEPILVSGLECTGSEFKVLDCPRGTYSVKSCGDYNEAGVKCQVPNSGLSEVIVPDYEVLDQTALRLSIIKVSLNGTMNENQQQSAFPTDALIRVSRSGLTFIIKIVVTDIFKRAVCDIWQRTDGGVNINLLPPCPCNLEQMSIDLDRYTKEKPFQFYLSKYYFKKSQATSCYRQSNIGISLELIHIIIGHILNDIGPFYLCCYGSYKSCKHYYDRRPNDNCADWPQRPPPAQMFGDPHLVTLDGYNYTFNGHGEFTLVESTDKLLTVQVRLTEPPIKTSNESNTTLAVGGTVITAIAARHKESDTVQFEVADDELIALVNGDIINFSSLSEYQYHNLTIIKRDNTTLTATLSDQLTFTVKERNGMLSDISVALSHIYYGKTYGLLGQYNGKFNDDLYPKDGEYHISINSSIEVIHKEFGLTWIIDKPVDSIFTYSQFGGWNTYYKPDYTPLFEAKFDDLELEEEALQ
uniref:Uncharacterized protein n=1 Tax=Amphimedon queenslandica TaxID=400682 RepID=A0A1X7T7Q6_AMPQE